MDTQREKCVMVIDGGLPTGVIANTAAILGFTLGKVRPEAVGGDVTDGDGNSHLGIVNLPVPILKGSPELLRELREKLYREEFQSLTAVDFSDLAQGCGTYEVFTEKLSATPGAALRYLGIAVCGARKLVDRLTGSLPLLR